MPLRMSCLPSVVKLAVLYSDTPIISIGEVSVRPFMLAPMGIWAIAEADALETGEARVVIPLQFVQGFIAVTAFELQREKICNWLLLICNPLKSGCVLSNTFTLRSEVLMAVPQFHTEGLNSHGLSTNIGLLYPFSGENPAASDFGAGPITIRS